MAAALALISTWAAAQIPDMNAPGGTVRSASFYEYDRSQPLMPDVKELLKNDRYTKYHVFYGSTNGERVPAYFFVPSKGKAPYPCIIVMHGSGGSKEDFGSLYDYMAQRNFAILAVDAAFHGERESEDIRAENADWYQTRNMMIQTVVDLRRGIDWLETRPEVAPERIGYLGASQGSFIGAIFAGVEKRVRATALLVGGADFRVFFAHSQIPSIILLRNYLTPEQIGAVADDLAVIDPKNYIGAVSPRATLFINGKHDYIISAEAAKRLQELAGEPKEIHWYEGSHLPAFDQVLVLVPKFFKKYMPPSKKPAAEKNASESPKPVIIADVERNTSDIDHRIITVTAKTKTKLPDGDALALNFPESGPMNFPLFDDGTHGDAKAGDGVWTMRFEFGHSIPDVAIIGGVQIYGAAVRAVDAKGNTLAEKDLGILTGEKENKY
jgi:dienelactone hydrolase